MAVNIVPVLWSSVEEQWPRIEAYVVSACRRGPLDADPEKLKYGCEWRDNQLWIAENSQGLAVGVAITQIVDGVCEWVAVGGSRMIDWLHLQNTIEEWARLNGCHAMRSYSRRGMVKRLPAYTIRGYILEKAI